MSAGGCRALVFGRYPAPGRVKTRLAAGVGADAACAFYSACLAYTVEQVGAWVTAERDERRHCSAALCYSDAGYVAALEGWLTRHSLGGVDLVPQAQDTQDLGVRLRTALADGLSQPGISCAVVVGSDSPDLSPAILRDAARALAHYDVVFGPCVDGGYYLVGCRFGSAALDVLFAGVLWSSPTVLAVSLSLAQGAGLHVAPLDTLPTLMDIDQVEDLVAFETRAAPVHPLHAAARAALAARKPLEVKLK